MRAAVPTRAPRAGHVPHATRDVPPPVGASPAMREVLAAAEDVAAAGTTVLIVGESGTGKEILARHIHRCSQRAAGPWVAVNCAALPAELLESELFGHERGAFTGASERRVGRIEQAHRGTLLLDEISELPLALQAKLLRVLQEREVDRVGGTRPIAVDVRVIATSNRRLDEMVARKEMRADLYYRLNVFPIELPPLRRRAEDLPALAGDLLRDLAQALGRQAPILGDDALQALARHPFPGNIRELGNVLERALVRTRHPILRLEDLCLDGACAPSTSTSTSTCSADWPASLPLDISALERLAIEEALRRVNGNRTHAARVLGISLRTLRNKLRAYRTSAAGTHAATVAVGQELPGSHDSADARARSATLARPSQRSSRVRAA
jgi:two-component system response regulator FlrC